MKVVLYSIDKEGNKYFDYTNDKEYIEVMNKMQTDFPSIIAIIPMIDIGYYKMEIELNVQNCYIGDDEETTKCVVMESSRQIGGME